MTNPFGRDRRDRENPFGRQSADPISAFDALGAGIGDAVTFGFSDELAGLAGEENRREQERRLELARAYHPGMFLGGQVIGGFGGGAGAGFIARGAGRLSPTLARGAANLAARIGPAGRIGVGTLTGAAGGALYGAGDSPDGMRAQGAANGALWGGAFGAGGQALGEVGGRVFGALGRSLSPEARSAHMVAGMQQRFGQTPEQLRQALQDAPEGAMLMDVLPGGTQITSGAAVRPSAEREALRSALDQRNNAMTGNAIDDLWQSLGGGSRRSASATVDEIASAQQREAKPLYDAVMSRPVDPARANSMLGEIIRRNPALFRGAQQDAEALMLSEHGTVFGQNDPRYWHYLQQGADQVFEKLKSQQGGLSGNERRVFGRALDAYRVQLRRLLGPEFGRAQSIWSGGARQRRAVELGFESVSTNANDLALGDVVREMRRMTIGELEHMRVGALAKLSDMLENASTGTGRADSVRSIIRSDGQRRVLHTLFGGEAQFNRLVQRLEQRRELFRNSVEAGVGVNSHTADRLLSYQSQVERTNPTRAGMKDAILKLITGDAADQYDEAVSNHLLALMRTPARRALSEMDAAGGLERWTKGTGLLSRAQRESQRLRNRRPRALLDAFATGLYAPVIGGSATDYGGV